jgi:hypothetical protein
MTERLGLGKAQFSSVFSQPGNARIYSCTGKDLCEPELIDSNEPIPIKRSVSSQGKKCQIRARLVGFFAKRIVAWPGQSLFQSPAHTLNEWCPEPILKVGVAFNKSSAKAQKFPSVRLVGSISLYKCFPLFCTRVMTGGLGLCGKVLEGVHGFSSWPIA